MASLKSESGDSPSQKNSCGVEKCERFLFHVDPLFLAGVSPTCGTMVEVCLSLLPLDAWMEAVKLSVIGCNSDDLGSALAASGAIWISLYKLINPSSTSSHVNCTHSICLTLKNIGIYDTAQVYTDTHTS